MCYNCGIMKNLFAPPNLFYLFLIIGTFVVSFALCPLLIELCKKLKLYDDVDPRKMHTGNVSRLGGGAIFISFIIAMVLVAIFTPKSYPVKSYIPVFAGGMIIFLLGISDDFIHLRAKFKFLIQICAAILATFSPCCLTSIFGLQLPVFISKFFTFFWILLLVNAYNLIDGIDLLCGGISFTTFAAIAFVQFYIGNAGFGFVAIILCAAIIGFLFWNKPTAKIFLGDGGSLTLGYFVAVLPLFPSDNPSYEFNKFIFCLLIASLPTIDVIASIIRRTRERRSIFSPDRAHLHHKLINIGFSKIIATLFLNGMQILICLIICFGVTADEHDHYMFVLIITYCFVIIFFSAIHYINRAINRKFKGKLAENAQKEY